MSTEELIEQIKMRPKTEIRCERILVPTDGSGQAFRAFREAICKDALGRMGLGHLLKTLLMVVDYDKTVSAFERVSLSGYVPAELKIAAYRFLADLMHVVPEEIRAHTRVESGDPREIIPAVAAEEESGLIVMGSRGLGAFHSLLIGSVSNAVLQQAACPVLLCKGMPDDWDEDGVCLSGHDAR